ncbi:hypothetical protein LIA77_11481 [Sarocladium implicatum]|nr:hypothetical protein LIA77_11481 [Sarocladium implicatum]
MPDRRLRGSTAYSTHKSTVANRRRLANMDPIKRAALRDRVVEYQAIWQLISRVGRKEEYRRATQANKRTMLINSSRALLEKRRLEGKAMCNTNAIGMIDRHLNKEANKPSLKGVAVDPTLGRDRDTPPATPPNDRDHEILDLGLKRDPATWLANNEADDDGQMSGTLAGSEYDSQYSDTTSFDDESSGSDNPLTDRVIQLEGQVEQLTRLFNILLPPGALSSPPSAVPNAPFIGGLGQPGFAQLGVGGGFMPGPGLAPTAPSFPAMGMGMGMFNGPHLAASQHGEENDHSSDDDRASPVGAAPTGVAPGWPFAPPGVLPMFTYGPPRHEQPSEGGNE